MKMRPTLSELDETMEPELRWSAKWTQLAHGITAGRFHFTPSCNLPGLNLNGNALTRV